MLFIGLYFGIMLFTIGIYHILGSKAGGAFRTWPWIVFLFLVCQPVIIFH